MCCRQGIQVLHITNTFRLRCLKAERTHQCLAGLQTMQETFVMNLHSLYCKTNEFLFNFNKLKFKFINYTIITLMNMPIKYETTAEKI